MPLLLVFAGGVGAGGAGGCDKPMSCGARDETELSDVAVERTLALADDRELVVDTDRRVLYAPCPIWPIRPG